MVKERKLLCTISGSFSKFKDIIDQKIEEMEDLGVIVLAPEKGWVYIPRQPFNLVNFRPLPSEIGKSIKQIEDEFLDCIRRSDFLYLVNTDSYVGLSVTMELGFALALKIPIYASEQIKLDVETQNDLTLRKLMREIKVRNPQDILKDFE